jgi:Ca2+-binding RTX toxin-like protein
MSDERHTHPTFNERLRLTRRTVALCLTLALVAAGLGAARPAAAAGRVIYVVSGGAGDGSSWANGRDLQAAIADAAPGDQIWVRVGIYLPTTNEDRTKSFQLKSGVAIYGGFTGVETDLSQRDVARAGPATLLSGDLGPIDGATIDVNDPSRASNSYHVVTATNVDSSAILDGFMIIEGNANGITNLNDGFGGGIAVTSASPTLRNLMVRGNSAYYGGGISLFPSEATLTNISVIENSASVHGGGIAIINSHVPFPLTNLLVTGNSAPSHTGGGIYTQSSDTLLTNVTISGNRGTGIEFAGGAIDIYNSIVWGNDSDYEGSIVDPFPARNNISSYSPSTNVNPQFVDPYPPSAAPTIQGDYRVWPISPAIDAGRNAVSGVPIPDTDRAGLPRLVDIASVTDTGIGTPPIIDIGAYELQNTTLETTITGFPLNPSSLSSPSFNFSGTDSGGGVDSFACRLDGGRFGECTSPKSYSGLTDGAHTFQVLARDRAGNVDTSPASFTWIVDTMPPQTTIDSRPATLSPSSSPSFSFSGTDGGSGVGSFACRLDGGGFTPCTSPQSYSNLAEGAHTFQVRAIDGAGNLDPTPAGVTWTIDTAPPDLSIDSYPSLLSNSRLATFTFSATDSGSGFDHFECLLYNGNLATCTSPKSYSGLADGEHTFLLWAFDRVGNATPIPYGYIWTIDTTPPGVTINQASGQADPTSASPVHFTTVFNEPVSGFTSTDVSLSGTAGATTAAVIEIAPNNGTTYDVAVSGMTTNGTVVASIPSGVATDATGNGNNPSTSSDNTVTFIANHPPTANNDTYTTLEDQALSVSAANGVLKNDGDLDAGDSLTAVLASNPRNAASFTLNADGSFSYAPAANFNGSDSFSYIARDSKGSEAAAATVMIDVTPVNDAPSFTRGQNVTVAEDSGTKTVSGWATMIAAGPTDESTQRLTFQVTNNNNSLFSAQPAITSDGTLTFTPAANATGSATVTVVLNDDGGATNGGVDTAAPQTFQLTITPVNDAPTVTIVGGDACTGDFSGRMLLNVSDVDNPTSSLVLTGSSSNTSVVPNGNITFAGSDARRTTAITALAGSSVGSATVTIQASDGSASSTITLTVIAGANKTDSLNGSTGADIIFAGKGNDTINADAGNDLICGGNGDNILRGGDGNDVIDASNGNDKLYGDAGNDILRGGNGDDTLTGGLGADFFSGGAGFDTAPDFAPSQSDTKDSTIP